jgi:hypothetical protein
LRTNENARPGDDDQDGRQRGWRAETSLPGLASVEPPTDEQFLAWTAGYLAGYDRGYEVRGREVNAEYPPDRVLVFGKWYRQALEREKADAEVRGR